MYEENMHGLGKFKFKKLFKKATKMLKKHPLAPMPVKTWALMKKKKKILPLPVIKKKPLPAPQVIPENYQEPLPSPVKQELPPYWNTGWNPQADDVRFSINQPEYQPQQSPSTYGQPSPSTYGMEFEDITEDFDDQPEPAPNDLPLITAGEFEQDFSDESDYLEGLAESDSWSDIFTGAASELLAQQRAKREAKARAAQNANMQMYARPQTGFDLNKLMLPAALGLGALFFLTMKKGRR